jgi:hypothetical protein
MAIFTDDLIVEHPVSIRQKVYDYLRNPILSNPIRRFAFEAKTRSDVFAEDY